MSRPVPASLAKLGITQVLDNLGPGQSVAFERSFVQIFREEIEQKFFTPAKEDEACMPSPAEDEVADSLPCHSDR